MKIETQSKSTQSQDTRALNLRKMRAFAILLLSTSIIGLGVSHYLGGKGIWGWTQSFFESAVVGALADWFAVVALFRHPFGIPIPHTAIIPKSKKKLAQQLSLFIRDNFLEPQALLDKLKRFDPASRLGKWLSSAENVKKGSDSIREWALQGLNWLDDAKLKNVLEATISDSLLKWDAGHQLSQILIFLTENGRHRELLNAILFQIGRLLSQEELKDRISIVVVSALEKEWPLIMGAANAVKLAPWMSERIVSYLPKLINHIQEILQNPDDEAHHLIEAKIQELIARLDNDPTLKNKINELKQDLITSQAFKAFTKSINDDIYTWLRYQLNHADSSLSVYLEKGLSGLGNKLQTDYELREAINKNILESSNKLVHDLRSGVTKHIAETINHWDDKKMVSEVELSLGKDLQFIRYNGTLVGGIVGLGLHGLQWILPTIH